MTAAAAADRLFGTYRPRGSAVEGWPVGVKYAALVSLGLPAFVARAWPVTLAALVMVATLLLAARLGARRALGLPLAFLVLLAVVAGVNAWTSGPVVGAVMVGNLTLAVWVSRLVVMTTPVPVLIDALVRATRPLARFGFKPERFGLTVLVMLRSIPYLAASFEQVGQAVAARGLRGQWGPRATQVVVRAVAYAARTGDAMAARGLGDD